jgi:hypothetical protein
LDVERYIEKFIGLTPPGIDCVGHNHTRAFRHLNVGTRKSISISQELVEVALSLSRIINRYFNSINATFKKETLWITH